MWIEVSDIAPGGLLAAEAKGLEIILCNDAGKIHAVDRRCGHMNAPLELGTLEGHILTCPMHHAQFDITSGEVLCGPVPPSLGKEPVPKRIGEYLEYVGSLMAHITTCAIKTYPVQIDGDSIKVGV